jgi:hypothetical protein
MMRAKSPAERSLPIISWKAHWAGFFVIVENYPQLKSDENFLRLQMGYGHGIARCRAAQL